MLLDQEFRDLMAGVCAPVTVITTADDDGPHGATVSSLASLSLRPALLSIALDTRSSLLARILTTGRFGVNVSNLLDENEHPIFIGLDVTPSIVDPAFQNGGLGTSMPGRAIQGGVRYSF